MNTTNATANNERTLDLHARHNELNMHTSLVYVVTSKGMQNLDA